MVIQNYSKKLDRYSCLVSLSSPSLGLSFRDINILPERDYSIEELREFSKQDLDSYNFKNINRLLLEFAFNKSIYDIYDERVIFNSGLSASQLLHHTSNCRLSHLVYDILQIKKYPVRVDNPIYSISRVKNPHKYLFINKKPRYFDMDIKKILKRLLLTHSINRFDYKDSLKRVNYNSHITHLKDCISSFIITPLNSPISLIHIYKYRRWLNLKPLKKKVRDKIRFHLLTLKSHPNKNTIQALKRQSDKRHYEVVTSYNGFNYRVLCKKYPFYIQNVVDTEFKNKFSFDNNFKIPISISQ